MKEKGTRKILLAVWAAALGCMICAGITHAAFSFWKNITDAWNMESVEDTVFYSLPEPSGETEKRRNFSEPVWRETFFWQESYVPQTSTGYRYGEVFPDVLSRYEQFEEFYCGEYSTAIPGLENTSFAVSATDQMVPQGICIAQEYMLITAYDKEGEENSVIYVLSDQDGSDRKLLTTIVLPDQNHVGGITCDGSRVWIAKSTTKYISMITCEWIWEAVELGQETVFLENYDASLYCGVTASFISYQDQRLWVGTSQSFLTKQGQLTVFRMLEEGKKFRLARQFTMGIPAHSQGISFVENNGRTYLLLNTSNGRFRDSVLFVYEEFINDDRVILKGKYQYTLPPMVEELASDGSYTYCLFESAATCYSTVSGMKCRYPVDRICALKNQLLVEG